MTTNLEHLLKFGSTADPEWSALKAQYIKAKDDEALCTADKDSRKLVLSQGDRIRGQSTICEGQGAPLSAHG